MPDPILTPDGIDRMKETIGTMRMNYPGFFTAPLLSGWAIQAIDDHFERTSDHARLGNAKPIQLADLPLIEGLIDDWRIKYERKITTMMFTVEDQKEAMRTQTALDKFYEKIMPAELTGKKRVCLQK